MRHKLVIEESREEGKLLKCSVCGIRWLVPDSLAEKLMQQPPQCLGKEAAVRFPSKVLRYADAVRRWNKAGRPTRTKEEIDEILNAICRPCPHYLKKSKTCQICGCSVNSVENGFRNKIAMATESCPAGKWGPNKIIGDRKKIRLVNRQCPGDIAVFTAAVANLHAMYPGEYAVDVDTTAPEIWHNNPNITPLDLDDDSVEIYELKYPLIHRSNQLQIHFIEAATSYLANLIGRPIDMETNIPDLYLSSQEKEGPPSHIIGNDEPYWIVNAGFKSDFTAKAWPKEYYQWVVNQTRDMGIQWVQIGCSEHNHQPLENVINAIDQTTTRELMQLVYHSQGGIGPSTFLQHLCAGFRKPYFCLLGGREPLYWVQYPLQQTFHTFGLLDCCREEACWISRTVKIGDESEQDNSLCKYPVETATFPSPKCMVSIKPKFVVDRLRQYIEVQRDGIIQEENTSQIRARIG